MARKLPRRGKPPPSLVANLLSIFGPNQREIADKLGMAQHGVGYWISQGHVPSQRIPQVIRAARRLDPPVKLQPNDFFPRESWDA